MAKEEILIMGEKMKLIVMENGQTAMRIQLLVRKYTIPTSIIGQRRTLELDVFGVDKPLLLSSAEMKNLDTTVDSRHG